METYRIRLMNGTYYHDNDGDGYGGPSGDVYTADTLPKCITVDGVDYQLLDDRKSYCLAEWEEDYVGDEDGVASVKPAGPLKYWEGYSSLIAG